MIDLSQTIPNTDEQEKPKNTNLGTLPIVYLETLSNEELDDSFQAVAQRERQTLAEVLVHIKEVNRRKLYLKMSFGSLFDYLTKHLKYSAGSAQRRIDAYRLSQEVPDVIENLESGDLNLAQVSLVQKSFREMGKLNGKSLIQTKSKQEEVTQTKAQTKSDQIQLKSQLIKNLKQKSIAESQVIVSKTLDLEVKSEMKLKHQADESVRFEITLSKEQWLKLNAMRDLISHSLPHGSWDQVLEHVADKVIASKTKVQNQKIEKKSQPVKAAGPSQTTSLYLLRKAVLKRDRCCQYRDQKTRKLCTSTWQLQIDHIKPRWAGGKDELANLRVLCGQHNRQLYRWQSGIELSER